MRKYLVFILTFSGFTCFSTLADEAQIATQRAQLKELMTQIDANDQAQAEQRQRLERLQAQLDCQWQYLQAGKQCDTQHGADIQARLHCNTGLRESLDQCLLQAQTLPGQQP